MVYTVNLPDSKDVSVEITGLKGIQGQLLTTKSPDSEFHLEIIIASLITRNLIDKNIPLFISVPSLTSIPKLIFLIEYGSDLSSKKAFGGIFPCIDVKLKSCPFDVYSKVICEDGAFKELIGKKVMIDPKLGLGSVFGVLEGVSNLGYQVMGVDLPIEGKIIRVIDRS